MESTTQQQFQAFTHLFAECTRTVYSSLYYAGIFIAFIVLPIYGVFLLRRWTLRRMENVLKEISRWDPTIWTTARDKSIFDDSRSIRWLEDLARWQRQYSRVKVVFGLPDLKSKFVHLSKAMLNVYLVRVDEVKRLSPEKRERVKHVLNRFAKNPAYDHLLEELKNHLR